MCYLLPSSLRSELPTVIYLLIPYLSLEDCSKLSLLCRDARIAILNEDCPLTLDFGSIDIPTSIKLRPECPFLQRLHSLKYVNYCTVSPGVDLTNLWSIIAASSLTLRSIHVEGYLLPQSLQNSFSPPGIVRAPNLFSCKRQPAMYSSSVESLDSGNANQLKALILPNLHVLIWCVFNEYVEGLLPDDLIIPNVRKVILTKQGWEKVQSIQPSPSDYLINPSAHVRKWACSRSRHKIISPHYLDGQLVAKHRRLYIRHFATFDIRWGHVAIRSRVRKRSHIKIIGILFTRPWDVQIHNTTNILPFGQHFSYVAVLQLCGIVDLLILACRYQLESWIFGKPGKIGVHTLLIPECLTPQEKQLLDSLLDAIPSFNTARMVIKHRRKRSSVDICLTEKLTLALLVKCLGPDFDHALVKGRSTLSELCAKWLKAKFTVGPGNLIEPKDGKELLIGPNPFYCKNCLFQKTICNFVSDALLLDQTGLWKNIEEPVEFLQ